MSKSEAQSQKQVHIVEDDPAVLDSMKVMLEAEGYTVTVYENAEKFHDWVVGDTARTAKGCLLLDLHMEGMGGIELIEKLRAYKIDIPIIVVTGAGTPTQKARAKELGAHAVYDKPVDKDVLIQTLDATLI